MSKTLLAVDDSTTMRKALEITFSSDEFRVLTAKNRAEASGLLRETPSVVLVDASAPDGEDPYAFCKDAREALPGAVIVLLTSKFTPYDARRGGESGVDDNLDKPFDTQVAIEKVRKLLLTKEGAPAAKASGQHAAAAPVRTGSAPAIAPAAVSTPMAAPVSAPAMATPVAAPPSKPTSTGAHMASAATASATSQLTPRLAGLGLSPTQIDAVTALSRDVIEKVVWEVVPQLAEVLIKEEIARLTR